MTSAPRQPGSSSDAGALAAAEAGLAPERLLQDWRSANDRALGYLRALHFDEAEAEQRAWRAANEAAVEPHWPGGADAVARTLAAVRRDLVPDAADPDARFLAWRLQRGFAKRADTAPVLADYLATPRLARGSMLPRRAHPRESIEVLRERRRKLPWVRSAHRRRGLLGTLVVVPTFVASGFMAALLPSQGGAPLELAITLLFGALFAWISIGFWTALMGFLVLLRGDRFQVTRSAEAVLPADSSSRTAIVVPICDEPVDRVFAGLRAVQASLARAGAARAFDFFVLSDTTDPSLWVQEEAAWASWCRDVDGFGRIFYRRRKVRLKRKSGNVADFCRRWGRSYAYMVMLDADSLMQGDSLVRLVAMMEKNPQVAVIQTAPSAVRRRSLFGRALQFSSRLYGPMFSAGLHYWQLGDGQYWGHNAILRVAPFMEHCALPRLSGEPPFGGEILSHDFVEAALLGRAGFTLWLAYDLGGSYEEVPATLLEEMRRDRRWCQGNLQHLRLLFREGFFSAHRALFLNGALSYISALIWLSFLVFSTLAAVLAKVQPPDYFPSGEALFPDWPIWRPGWAVGLAATTAVVLFLPKLLSIALVLVSRRARSFGGVLPLLASAVLETLFSTLLAPVRMAFHSRFVLTNLLGREVAWVSGQREDRETSWRAAFAKHGADTLVGALWGVTVAWLNPDYLWWLLPIVGALVLSVPFSVLASRVSLGESARRRGLFAIPEELAPPPELVELEAGLVASALAGAQLPAAERDGFVRAVVDPFVNALHCALARGDRKLAPPIRAARRALVERVLADGPDALAKSERRTLLLDPELMGELHRRVWAEADAACASHWGRPGL